MILKGTSPSPIRTKPFSFLRTYYLLRLELLKLLAFVKLFKALLFYFRVILNNNRNNKVRELDAFARTIRSLFENTFMPLDMRNAGYSIIKSCGFYSPVYQIPLCCEVFHGSSWPPPRLPVRFLPSTTKTRR